MSKNKQGINTAKGYHGKVPFAENADVAQKIAVERGDNSLESCPVVVTKENSKEPMCYSEFAYNPTTKQLLVDSVSGVAGGVQMKADNTTDKFLPVLFVLGGGGQSPKFSSGLSYNPATKTLKADNFEGTVTVSNVTESVHADNADRATEADRADDVRMRDVLSLEDIDNIVQSGVSCPVNIKENITISGVVFPQYSKGWLSTATDAVISVIDTSGVIYSAYKSSGRWQGARKSNVVERATIADSATTANSATTAAYMQRNIIFKIVQGAGIETIINIVYYSNGKVKNLQRIGSSGSTFTMTAVNVDMGSVCYISITEGNYYNLNIPGVFRGENTIAIDEEAEKYLRGKIRTYSIVGGGEALIEIKG